MADGLFISYIRYAIGLYCPIRIKETDPNPTCINGIKVVYNDVLRLLCCSKRENRKPIKEMLNEVGWLSLNQLACETRLIEVWKSLNLEEYCLKDVFEKVEYSRFTRGSEKIRSTAICNRVKRYVHLHSQNMVHSINQMLLYKFNFINNF